LISKAVALERILRLGSRLSFDPWLFGDLLVGLVHHTPGALVARPTAVIPAERSGRSPSAVIRAPAVLTVVLRVGGTALEQCESEQNKNEWFHGGLRSELFPMPLWNGSIVSSIV
jgi:hypothetical protein